MLPSKVPASSRRVAKVTTGLADRSSRKQYCRRGLASFAETPARSIKALTSVLIANRGEIALRVGRTASEYGIRTTTLYTDPDATSQHTLSSPFAINLGNSSAYLDGGKIIEVAKAHGCDSIHPGYGFLSENSAFARSCADAGLTFIGPHWEAIEAMGNKSRSKEIMTAAGVPCIPGYHGSNQDPAFLQEEARKIGYPVLLKAVKGGGGKGMRISQSPRDFQDQLDSAKSEARNSFGDDTMLVEKYITTPRHIEVQVFADRYGNCVALGERDCSIQRRHQKIIEESPAPNLDDSIREDLWEKARAAALAVGYQGAGTVEFIFDNDTGEYFFMEMNTRLQVEHPVTEMVTGQDLVRWQLMVAEGHELPLTQNQIREHIKQSGWAFEARIYAENPDMNFIPDSGKLLHLRLPPATNDVRIDAGFIEGDEVSAHYDPMIAKLIVRGESRPAALQKLAAALERYEIAGPRTNIEFLKRICASPQFARGEVETGYIEKHREELFAPQPVSPEVWAQAALGVVQQDMLRAASDNVLCQPGSRIGFGPGYQKRQLRLCQVPADGSIVSEVVEVTLQQTAPSTYTVAVKDNVFSNITSSLLTPTSIRSFFPHLRLEATIIQSGQNQITVFQQGQQYRLQLAVPTWAEKALGIKDVANSVLAPMPCKVLRVDVKEGDEVRKDQSLVVIESMKMETVIRSPGDGVVAKIVHKQGGICKAGTALIEFVAPAKSL